ncbi:hypothetical protein ACQEVM_19555 [Streptomyces sp. CA-243310]|uniref:hypothetical protein n=1 Tax=Streptomyces sp. CA-243310 TaxID=3240056 RepID=UPI003D92180F
MNGNPTYHAVALGIATLVCLPLVVAVLRGRRVPWVRRRALAPRPYAWGVLCFYAVAPVNALPRILDAPQDLVLACTAAGVVCVMAGAAFMLRAERLGVRSKGSPAAHE